MRTCLGHATKGRDSSEAMLGFLFKDGAVLLKESYPLASPVSSQSCPIISCSPREKIIEM